MGRYGNPVNGVPLPGAGLVGADVMVAAPGGRRLRTMVGGPKSDTLVVLEAGLGISGLYWAAVHRELSRTCSVVAYERAGIGGSDPAPPPRNLAALADDLEAVVDAFPHTRLVLVGHSWGGPIVRVVAARRLRSHHDDVIGVVLVDQSDENDPMFFSAMARGQSMARAAVTAPLAEVGLLAKVSDHLVAALPAPLRHAVVDASCSPTAARTAAEEERHVIEGLRQLRDAPPDLDHLPLRVISAQLAGPFEGRVRAGLIRAHLATVRAHPGATYVAARGAGHMTAALDPRWVCAAVDELVGNRL